MEDILQSTSPDVEQVTIEPNGTWHSDKTDDQKGQNGHTHAGADDDLIEIGDFQLNFKREETTESASLLATPIAQARSNRISSVPKSSQKRPPPQVVDLTGSDDEDDQPVRPAKRQAFGDLLSRRDSQISFAANGYATEDIRSSTGQDSLSLSPGRSYIDL